MSPHVYGYVVDLEDGKNLTERFDLMCASGIPSGNIFVERQGNSEIRPQLDRLLRRVRPGDTLTFESIYGIGYNSGAISENLERVSRIGNVSVVLLDMPLMRACQDDAGQRMISNMVNIVVEKQSGKDFDRPRYQKLLRRLRAGDTLVIKSLDRLGRDYLEIQNQWRIISKERGVAIVVLDMPLLNTKENAELIGQLITDLVLQLLSFVAQTERESIRARQREGIEAAKARGVRFGRPRLPMPEGFTKIVKQWREGKFTALEAAHQLGISRTTFFRRVRELERERKVSSAYDLSETSVGQSYSPTSPCTRRQSVSCFPLAEKRSLILPAAPLKQRHSIQDIRSSPFAKPELDFTQQLEIGHRKPLEGGKP